MISKNRKYDRENRTYERGWPTLTPTNVLTPTNLKSLSKIEKWDTKIENWDFNVSMNADI